ncbi:MAG: hypothetical protein HY898_29520 [Deltaproteobacteria bacterium]|nr:hypothetical protein [Deltaproteobacteria bacterium]
MLNKLIVAAWVAWAAGLSCSPGPLGTCPAGSPVTRCVPRVDAWKALGSDASADAEDGASTDAEDGASADADSDAAVDQDGGQGPPGCPSTEALGPEGITRLGLSGYRFDGEATYDPSTDRCCYTTVGSGC